MTQDEAIATLTEMLNRKPNNSEHCTGNTITCPIDECMICGVRDCLYQEPLHYHHDGCPACYSQGEGGVKW